MKSDLECLVCLLKQGLNAVRLATQDRKTQRRVLDLIAWEIPETDLELPPAVISTRVYEIVSEVTGVEDPFLLAKKQSNTEALRVLPRLEKLVAAARDPVRAALHLAVAGNIIDIGIGHSYNLAKDVVEIMNTTFAVDDYESFRDELKPRRKLLYLGDNSGEIVFDRVLVNEILKAGVEVIFSVKSGAIINDATMEDARIAGIADLVPVIETGSKDIGVNLAQASVEFQKAFKKADFILAKGHGNFETCSGLSRNIYFLLKAKCDVVARKLGVRTGDIVFKHQKS